ncbi:MarR family transcriptional regulator [Streptomyces sp. NPDC003374]
MTTTEPALDGRVIALAHHAARALLEGVLARHGMTFHQSVTLRAVVAAGGTRDGDELAADVTGSLKTEESVVRAAMAELTAAGLLEADPQHVSAVRLTDTGRRRYETTTAETAEISARLYDGIPAGDLAVAGRVLTLITRRANAELAGV